MTTQQHKCFSEKDRYRIHLSKEHKGYKNELEKRRLKKWNKIEEKPPKNHTNSLKTIDNNVNSYSTNSHPEEQGQVLMMEQCY